VIIQDRGYLSYPAYQAENEDEIDEMLEQHVKISPRPDFFFILDLSPEAALARIARGRTKVSLLEKAEILKTARERYLSMPKRLGGHVIIVDADRGPSSISTDIINTMGIPKK